MAVILLQAAGAALGGVFGPIGAILGQAAGALAGSLIDQSLINSTRTIRGKGLSGARIPSADEGTPIFRVHGTARIAGTLIWATRFEETVTVERRGGKGRGPKVETYSYHANFAIGLCEGPIACVRRVWADGRELDLATVEMRVHRGSMTQLPDPLIEAKQGAGTVPAWRGLAYVVFERLPLDGFGNRMPVLQFEVVRPIGDLEERINAVAIIPGATEHGYATGEVSEDISAGETRMLNRNSRQGATDWAASIDELQAVCPNLTSVALVTAWMGTDLRAGSCRFVPGVELTARGESRAWKVGNFTRTSAHLVSQIDGGPIYGGTPDDLSVIEAIRDLKARGLKVVLYPFVLMDVPPGNGLPDPYGGAEQARLPWRGRITCIPAPGLPGTPDRSAAIRDDIAALCGAASPADMVVGENGVDWAGADDDGYRRMILHNAGLALAAGGVDGFLIGSELRGLTRLRDETGAFPFVEALCGLAADVKAMLGAGTTVTYGADWSEYFGYQPQDGTGDVCFNLDTLWAHPAIDAIGIDNYMPLSDWRVGDRVTGNPDGHHHANDRAAMRAMVTAGEGFDWFYAGDADRVDAGRKAGLDHRTRRAGGRQRRGAAECLSRSAVFGRDASLFLRRCARRRRAARLYRSHARPLAGRQCARRHGGARPDLSVVLGCAALSGVSGALGSLVRRRQLARRPLAQWPARRRAARRPDRRYPHRSRLSPLRRVRRHRRGDGARHRCDILGARTARAAA